MLKFEPAIEEETDILKSTLLEAFSDASLKEFGREDVLPPGVGDGSQIVKAFSEKTIFVIRYEEKVIGGIILEIRENKENYLQTLWIIPEYQDRKFGGRALEFIEKSYPETESWVLETPKQSKRNIYFYEKHGYQKYDEQTFEGSPVILFHFRKRMKN